MTPMREKIPGENPMSAYVLRPVAWALWQLTREARAIRRYQRAKMVNR